MNRLVISTMVAVLVCGLAWGLPAASGHMTYGQFWFAVGVTVVCLALLLLCLCPLRRRRAVAVRLMAIGFGLVLAFGIAETLALVWPTDHLADNPWYLTTGQALEADTDLPWLRPPGIHWTGSSRGDLAMETDSPDPDARVVTFQTDSQGFRNSRDMVQADLLFIGDSFTEAGNVSEEETFVWRTGQALDAPARNMGVAGYGPPSELVLLRKFGLGCKPKVVIWQIAETNDLDDAMFFVEWQQAGRPNVLPGFSKAKPTHAEAWQRRSPTRLLYRLLQPDEQAWPFCGEFVDQAGVAHTLRFEMSFPPDAQQHPGWPIVEYSLSTGAQLLKENQIQLVVMLIPRKLRVMAPESDIHAMEIDTPQGPMRVEHQLPPGWDLEPQARLANQLAALCERLQVPFIDTTDPLREKAAAGQLVYQAMDTHLSPAGHQIVADLLIQQLTQP